MWFATLQLLRLNLTSTGSRLATCITNGKIHILAQNSYIDIYSGIGSWRNKINNLILSYLLPISPLTVFYIFYLNIFLDCKEDFTSHILCSCPETIQYYKNNVRTYNYRRQVKLFSQSNAYKIKLNITVHTSSNIKSTWNISSRPWIIVELEIFEYIK